MARTLTTLLAIAAIAFPAATSASTSTAPTLSLVQRAPVQVRGLHFKARERVVLTATSGERSATVSARSNRRGRFLADFGSFTPNWCLPLAIKAVGAKGDRAKLVVQPPPLELPCRI
jgi:hypothetical protein